MRTDAAVRHIQSLDVERAKGYETYFETMRPETQEDIFRRWIFAYASVHTSWKYNVALYNNLKDLTWVGDKQDLHDRIVDSRAGLHNNRTKFIHAFSGFFYDHPGWFLRSPWETWFEYRDRLMEHTPGLGIAKTSFALELVHFHDTATVCFDTHQLQLYGLTTKQIQTKGYNLKTVKKMEQHWVHTCKTFDISPVTARWLYFDDRQGEEDSRYWSHVIDEQPYEVVA